ncbi:MAG TPA: hypothetical protein VMY36_03545 [Patescibacteria group bacterium]|nr:hypothetical protein [Patescibacteria group bacterium]
MQVLKSLEGYKLCLSAKELAQMNIVGFFAKLFSNKGLQDKPYDSKEVKEFISKLSKSSVDSKEYEYYTALLDLYHAFEKKCDFCFKLKSSYDPKQHSIRTIEDLEKFKDDPPDVIVKYQKSDYPFELKRYRGDVTFDRLYSFIKKKIVDHYSGKLNFLIVLQPSSGSVIDFGMFKQIHEELKNEKNQPGYIGITFNHDNIEIVTIRVLPKLEKYIRPYSPETDLFSDLLHS